MIFLWKHHLWLPRGGWSWIKLVSIRPREKKSFQTNDVSRTSDLKPVSLSSHCQRVQSSLLCLCLIWQSLQSIICKTSEYGDNVEFTFPFFFIKLVCCSVFSFLQVSRLGEGRRTTESPWMIKHQRYWQKIDPVKHTKPISIMHDLEILMRTEWLLKGLCICTTWSGYRVYLQMSVWIIWGA